MERRPAGHEVELKLTVAPADGRRLLRSPAVLAIAEGPPRAQTLRSVYYDSAELALWKSDLVLRVRAAGRRRVVGVKTRGVVRGGLVAREEVEAPLAGGPRDLRRVTRAALLAAISEPRLRLAVARAAEGPLGPRVETRFRRVTLPLRLGAARVELAFDLGEVHAGRRRLPIHEIELELLAGPARALFDVALRLAAEAELRPASLGKAERGFAQLLGEEPAAVRAQPIALARGASFEGALGTILGECLRHLAENQPAVAAGCGAEGIHQMRVGARRLRSALRLFEPWLPRRIARALADELRWLAGELGRARDLDVFLAETLGPILADRPDDPGLVRLRDAAEAAHRDAYAAAALSVDSQRYALLVLQLGRLVEIGSRRASGSAPHPRRAAPAARRLLGELARPVRRLGARIDRLSPPQLHRLRIRTKRLRYAMELLGPLLDAKEAERAARRLAELQDVLGHLNDLASAETLIGALPTHAGASPATVRAEGFVLGYAARSAAAGRVAIAQAWRRVARLDVLAP